MFWSLVTLWNAKNIVSIWEMPTLERTLRPTVEKKMRETEVEKERAERNNFKERGEDRE